MRRTSHSEALVSAFSAPDAQPIAFRLPGHLGQDRVHLMARNCFGYRAEVERDGATWVVWRREYLDACERARLERHRRRQQQKHLKRASLKPAIALRGGL